MSIKTFYVFLTNVGILKNIILSVEYMYSQLSIVSKIFAYVA